MKKSKKTISRRSFLKGAAAGAALLTAPGIPFIVRKASASPPPIKIAVVDALSGAYSRNGNLVVQSTKAMMGWINDNGGIKSLDGAKLVPVIADCKSTVEGAANAMERLCNDPDIVLGQATWGSSFSMAATSVTEKLRIPSFSGGFSEKITDRGFKYVFAPYPGFQDQMKLAMPVLLNMFKSVGKDIKTLFIASSNNVSDMLFCDGTQKYLEKRGVETVGKEIWPLGSLTDASTIMQKIRRKKPDIVIYGGSALSEVQLFLMKQKELRMKDTIFFASSGYIGDPNLKFGGEYLDSWIGICPCYPNKVTPQEWKDRTIEQCRKEYSDEAWIAQELAFAMCIVPIYAEALEICGSRKHDAIADTLRKLDLNNVMATKNFPKLGCSFNENGRLAEKYHGVEIIQWQNGECIVIYPDELAMATPRFVF
jgi:branched-chain amino acid transport system substrate-binding protein